MSVCSVIWTERNGECDWCHQPKRLHLGPLHEPNHRGRVYRCSRCDYQFWDAAYGDVEAHWSSDHRAEDSLAGVLRWLRHGATCNLQAVRDNAPDDPDCSCGLREAFTPTAMAAAADRMEGALG